MTSQNTPVPSYVYVTYIRADAKQVWQALTDADVTARYWAHANESDWRPGSPWTHRRVEPHEDIVRLTVTHENLPNHDMRGGIADGWPTVMANLKSLLETGTVLPQPPWEMPRADVNTR